MQLTGAGFTAAVEHAVDQAGAARIAIQKYGGHSLGVEQDTAQGQPSWEVELAESDQGRIEVDVAQRTGAILTDGTRLTSGQEHPRALVPDLRVLRDVGISRRLLGDRR